MLNHTVPSARGLWPPYQMPCVFFFFLTFDSSFQCSWLSEVTELPWASKEHLSSDVNAWSWNYCFFSSFGKRTKSKGCNWCFEPKNAISEKIVWVVFTPHSPSGMLSSEVFSSLCSCCLLLKWFTTQVSSLCNKQFGSPSVAFSDMSWGNIRLVLGEHSCALLIKITTTWKTQLDWSGLTCRQMCSVSHFNDHITTCRQMKSADSMTIRWHHMISDDITTCRQMCSVFFFLRFCWRTWTKRCLITSQTRVKRVRAATNVLNQFRMNVVWKRTNTVNPEYFACTKFSYPWDPDLSYAWNFRTAADGCWFSDLLSIFSMHFIFVRKLPCTK